MRGVPTSVRVSAHLVSSGCFRTPYSLWEVASRQRKVSFRKVVLGAYSHTPFLSNLCFLILPDVPALSYCQGWDAYCHTAGPGTDKVLPVFAQMHACVHAVCACSVCMQCMYMVHTCVHAVCVYGACLCAYMCVLVHVHTYRGQRQTPRIHLCPTLSYTPEMGPLTEPGTQSVLARLPGRGAPAVLLSPLWGFYMCAGDLNSGPHGRYFTPPSRSPQYIFKFIIVVIIFR
jgi:hypothetical protein